MENDSDDLEEVNIIPIKKEFKFRPSEESLSIQQENRELRMDLDHAKAELKFLQDREKYFARALQVAEGGLYRTDWDVKIRELIEQRDKFKAEIEALQREKANSWMNNPLSTPEDSPSVPAPKKRIRPARPKTASSRSKGNTKN